MDAADLVFSGIARQAQLVRDGEITSRELVQACLDRIEELDPRLNAWRVVLAERALAEADQADGRRGAGDRRPLLGVPLAIKDDADVAGETTTFGTAAHGPAEREDSAVVRRLREAGAIVLGKTNVPEMTQWPFTESKTFGPTRNPWDPSRTPGGSSGGTGAAVASGMVGAGLGSDGAGSVRIPSAWCGLFGIKPTRGRVSILPHDEIRHGWHRMAIYGPLARSVADAALFFDAAAEPGGAEPLADAARRPPGRLRIALSFKRPPGTIARLDPEHRQAVLDTAELLRSLGHEVVERDPDYGPRAFVTVLGLYLRGISDSVGQMPHPERLERRTRSMARLGRLWPEGRVARLREGQDDLRARIDRSLEGIDAVLTPGPAQPPPEVGRWEGRGALWTVNAVAALVPWYGVFNATGHPAVSVPAGQSSKALPLAVQLVGRWEDEATLVALSAQLEAERPWAQRRPPVS